MNAEKYHVLILDDDIALGEMLREFLENTQLCDVIYISHIEDFWHQLSSAIFDIVFLDYRMPDRFKLLPIRFYCSCSIFCQLHLVRDLGISSEINERLRKGGIHFQDQFASMFSINF